MDWRVTVISVISASNSGRGLSMDFLVVSRAGEQTFALEGN